jgi:hypothetical protein
MLSQVIAAAFKSKGKKRMAKSDLTYLLSFDFKWFSHSMSKRVVEEAIKSGLLTFNEGKLEPTFDLKSVEVPLDFKPDIRRIFKFSVFDELVDLISDRMEKSKVEVVAEINKMQEKFSGLLSAEIVALIYAKSVGVDVTPYFKPLWDEIF